MNFIEDTTFKCAYHQQKQTLSSPPLYLIDLTPNEIGKIPVTIGDNKN